MNANTFTQMAYKNKSNWTLGESKPNSNPIKPNFKIMNVNFCATVYYESKQKALKKPPLLEVNSEPLRKDW